MKAYHFNTVVEKDGSVHLSGLPPQTEVEIIVLERTDLPEELQQWLHDIRARHPFAKMSKEEILKTLRQTRETVWSERHAS
jgi:hypothetical protein